MLDFRILGPLEVRSGSAPVVLSGGRQRAVLALLLLYRNDVVPLDRIVDELWGQDAPSTARTIVHGCVSKLRRELGETGSALVTQPPGYVLKVDRAQLDAERFEQLLAEGVRAVRESRHGEAAERLDEALGLWRGAPLADFVYEPFAQDTIRRLEELRLTAVEHRVEARLALGAHAELVTELETLVAANPFREQLHEQLLVALYRSGRQKDALERYTELRRMLSEELGVDPRPSLQELQKAILRHDESLGARPLPPVAPVLPAEVIDSLPLERERRRRATVLFCELADAEELADRLDPEPHRRLLHQFADLATNACQRHGARVDRPFGEVVMATFGVPVTREDDAVRAVRAAVLVRDAVAELADLPIPAHVRVTVETGDIVVDESADAPIAGPAVRAADALRHTGADGEIVLGPRAHALVRHAARTEHDGTSFRLLSLLDDAPAREAFDSPLVGREQELAQLRQALARSVSDRICSLFTILGAAGIGKSRLAAEFRLDAGERADVLVGRSPPYGEGVTFGPLREMLVQAVGEPLELKLAEAANDEIAQAVGGLLGLNEWSRGLEAGFLAVRRLLSALARERTLVLAFEDLHWADPLLLDLIEYLLRESDDVPLLILCLARRDLLDQRPTWAGGQTNAVTLRLDQLSDAEATELAAALTAESALSDADRARAVALAEGNPLFLGQLLTYATEQGLRERPLPPTIEALLAARLDLLGPAERLVVERAAVLGREFVMSELGALVPDELQPTLDAHVAALARKELVARPRDDGTCRFRHVLIRDAAYRFMTRELRAELHERIADADDVPDEVAGYHLEQAFRERRELEPNAPGLDRLAARACDRLEAAGRKTLARGLARPAAELLQRAAALADADEPRQAALLADVGTALIDIGALNEAAESLARARAVAQRNQAAAAEARVDVEEQFLALRHAEPDAVSVTTRVVLEAIPMFEQLRDEHGLSRAWKLKAAAHWYEAHAGSAAAAWEHAAEHAQAAGEHHEHADLLSWVASSLWFGPTPVEQAIERCAEIRAAVAWHPASLAETLRALGGLHGFAGRFDEARGLFAESATIFAELGLTVQAAASHPEAVVELLAGDPAGAERMLARDFAVLEEEGEVGVRSTTAALLARAALDQGRVDDAERYAEESRWLAHPNDLLTQIVWRGVRARTLQERGRTDEAIGLAGEAVALAESTDLVNFHADALVDLALVFAGAAHAAESERAASRALELYGKKGNVVALEHVRSGAYARL